jgi:outer membrane protein W
LAGGDSRQRRSAKSAISLSNPDLTLLPFVRKFMTAHTMHMKSKTIGSFIILMILMWSSFSYAQKTPSGWDTSSTAGGIRFGTSGFGLELIQSLRDNVNTRFGLNFYHGTYDTTRDEVEYDIDVNLQSWTLLLDWYPSNSEFRVSGGFLYNGNNVEVLGKPAKAMRIGDTKYTPAEIGTLTYKADFRKFAPYLGIGVSNANRKDRQWSFTFDLGVIFQGSPDMQLSANGLLASDPIFQEELRKEEADAKDEIHNIKYYPVIAFGVTYRFR